MSTVETVAFPVIFNSPGVVVFPIVMLCVDSSPDVVLVVFVFNVAISAEFELIDIELIEIALVLAEILNAFLLILFTKDSSPLFI